MATNTSSPPAIFKVTKDWRDFLSSVILGGEPKGISPIQTATAALSRWVGGACLFCGCMAILIASAKQAPPLNLTHLTTPERLGAFLPLVLAGLHLMYLSVVLRLLIFNIPSYRLKMRSLIIPLVLIVSYISYAADAYSDTLPLQTVNFKRVAIFLFIVVYALWALRDWCEEANSPGDLALMRIYWLTADVVIIICLFVDFVFHVPKSFGYIAVKDWVVFGCLIVYYLLHRTTISLKRRSFVQVYSSYLDSLTGNPITIAGKTADIKNAIRILMQKDSLAVLDFGAGDGRRLWWALDEIDLLKDKPSKGVTVLAYDKLKEWKRFIYAAKATQLVGAGWNLDNTFTNSFSQAKKFASKADLIHASHSVYDTKALRQLSRLIRRSPSGCIFILRGIGSSIFRRMSEGVCLMNPGATNLSFLWSTQFLETLVSSGLSYLLSNHLDSCLVINQPLDDTAKNRLIDFLRALYAGEWSEKMEGLHEAALHHEGLGGNINNQDWMLFFKKT